MDVVPAANFNALQGTPLLEEMKTFDMFGGWFVVSWEVEVSVDDCEATVICCALGLEAMTFESVLMLSPTPTTLNFAVASAPSPLIPPEIILVHATLATVSWPMVQL